MNKDFLVGRRLMANPACDCGDTSPMITMTNFSCLSDMGQFQRFALVEAGEVVWDTVTPANNIPVSITLLVITEVAGWNILKVAPNNTKVVFSPLALGASSGITGGAAQTTGGDNSTPSGETKHNGFLPADGVMRIDSMYKDQIAILRTWECKNIEMYPINQNGQILARQDTAGLVTGFPITNFRVGTKTGAILNTSDYNEITWQMAKNYDEFLAFFIPTDFQAISIS